MERRADCPIALYVTLTVAVVVSLAPAQLAGFGWSRHLAHPIRFVWGDFDGDGQIDQLAIERGEHTTRVALELSSGGTSPALETTSNLSFITVADVDGDGDLDILAASSLGASELWLNDGHGRLTLSKQTTSTSTLTPLTISSSRGTELAVWRVPLQSLSADVGCCEMRGSRRIRAPAHPRSFARGLRSAFGLRGPPVVSLTLA